VDYISPENEILNEIKDLVKEKGYIYVLCILTIEEFCVAPEKLHEINTYTRLNENEINLLLGFFIQNGFDLSPPEYPQKILEMKNKTKYLLKKLHSNFMKPFNRKIMIESKKRVPLQNYREIRREFFNDGEILKESIFYAGSGAYYFQYSDLLEKKYAYDIKWLKENKNFDLEKAKVITEKIKEKIDKKISKIEFYDYSGYEFSDKCDEDVKTIGELHSYFKYFIDIDEIDVDPEDDLIDLVWKKIYDGIFSLFIIEKSEFEEYEIDSFLKNFSIDLDHENNEEFEGIGHFNIIEAKPILHLDKNKYFILNSISLYEAVYNSPFYWMSDDEEYEDEAWKNRGKVGEEITYELLSDVFGSNSIYNSVLIKDGKNTVTDIDILCLYKNKAIVVQVKSKKLTKLSRIGDDEQLAKDFKGAVQNAYEQGLKSRSSIFNENLKFIDKNGNELTFSDDVNEVYILGITTESYPSLTFHSNTLLDKKNEDPSLLVVSIFDLEILTHYLDNPKKFLDYVEQRTSKMEDTVSGDELHFLGMYLKEGNIQTDDKSLSIVLNYAELIDRDYAPKKLKLNISNHNNPLNKL